MEKLNAEQIIKALEEMNMVGVSPFVIRKAISLIKELTQAHEMLSESYDHLEKTKDELLSERARLTEENERLHASCTELEKKYALAVAEREANVKGFSKMLVVIHDDTVRKMQERLKAVAYQSNDWSHGEHPMVVEVEDIDQIAEEMLEGKDENT